MISLSLATLGAVLYLAKGKNFQANHNVLTMRLRKVRLCFT